MLADMQLFLVWTLLTILSFWMIPHTSPRARQNVTGIMSFLLVFAFAPWAALFVLWMYIAVLASAWVLQRWRHSFLILVSLLSICLPLLAQRTLYLDVTIIATLGLTFATLRAVSIVLDGYATRSAYPQRQIFLCLFFLPLYTVGPVESIKSFGEGSFARRPDWGVMLVGLRRIAVGLFKAAYIADELIRAQLEEHFPLKTRDFSEFSSPDALLFVLLSFLYTYINFSGFVDVAVGVSRLFGLQPVENFNYPLASRNLRDFWKRWHMSLGAWITRYLYFPMVTKFRTQGGPYLATFIAFVLVGWWHETTATYIFWGVMHGAGLCLVMFWQRAFKKHRPGIYSRLQKNWFYILACWGATVLYVAWVQTFANQRSWDEAVQMTRALVGA